MRTENLHARRSSERIGRKLGIGHWAIGAFFFIAALPQATGQTLSLTASDHNEYNISCFGGRDGSIDLTVTGGTPPYTYTWSHGPTTQDVSSLAAGYYSVDVVDASNNEMGAFITLTEPRALSAELTSPEYGNGFNISLFGGYDGSIALEMDGGVAPYTYLWTDGPTTQNRTQLNSDAYRVRITDANSCELLSEALFLRQPDRSDWTMTGNAGTNPATHFFGTTDNKDVVFKSNGAERLRLKSNGDVLIPGLADGGLLKAGPGGLLQLDGWPQLSGAPLLYWSTSGNFLTAAPTQFLGTRDNYPLVVKINNSERMRLTTAGRLGLGTATPQAKLHVHDVDEVSAVVSPTSSEASLWVKNNLFGYGFGVDEEGVGRILYNANDPATAISISGNGKVGIGTDPTDFSSSDYRLFVEDGIATRDVQVKLGTWPDYVFNDSYHLLPLNELRAYVKVNKHLPGFLSARELEARNGVELGDTQRRLVQVVEEQALYILQLEERLVKMEQRLSHLETTR